MAPVWGEPASRRGDAPTICGSLAACCCYYYFDYAQYAGEPGAPWEGKRNGPVTLEGVYTHDPIPAGLDEKRRSLVLGLQSAVWTEFIRIQQYFDFMAYPRPCAFSQVCCSSPGAASLEDFQTRMVVHEARLTCLQVNFRHIVHNGFGNNLPFLVH